MKSFLVTDIPEFSNKERIVVVGIIGKSSSRYANKAAPMISDPNCDQNGIECFWDEKNSILYLHATTNFDTSSLINFVSQLGEAPSEDDEANAAHWLVASGQLAVESCRIISLLFNLCHIIILSSPNSVFDLGYLQVFKAVDCYRKVLQTEIMEALIAAGLEGAWEMHGRLCCPRLLFHFRSAPRQLRKSPAALKRLEHAVEDQLYSILRKSRIIMNVCAKSLFAIPKNEEFVYISSEEVVGNARDVSSLLKGLVRVCIGENAPDSGETRQSFSEFLQTHVQRAFAEGFDDNVGKYAMTTSFFELPSAATWRKAAQVLAPIYLHVPESMDDNEKENKNNALWYALATDVRFSKARCAKVLPIAQASYTEGLPSHYSTQHHLHKVNVSVRVLETMARGPLAAKAVSSLVTQCEATWRNRRLCEAPSLTGNVCIKPQHDNTEEHSSGVRYVSACSCGRTKCTREDPYSVKRANCTFYTDAAAECGSCVRPEILFPIFQPSTPTYKAACVKEGESMGDDNLDENESPNGAWSPSPESLSPGTDSENDDISPKPHDYIVPLAESDKGIVRQPSTTEYLPGMLHTESPEGLLPAYSSWWLSTLGASSLYSHNLGLPEHLQPGFLAHTNYLLPWDCALRVEQMGGWRSSRGRNPVVKHHHVTVKIFLGFEYECGRGHRFMMSSPDSVMSSMSVNTAGAGAALSSSDMPLYATCPCRGPSTMLAQLTRIHVVTPKAPVFVTLDPKIQPVPGGPIFVPQPVGSPTIKLSGASYWILRLPYIYRGERGPLPRPSAPVPPKLQGRIIAPLIGLTD